MRFFNTDCCWRRWHKRFFFPSKNDIFHPKPRHTDNSIRVTPTTTKSDDLWRTMQIGEWHLSRESRHPHTHTRKRPWDSLRYRLGDDRVEGLLWFRGDRGRLNGRDNRTTDSWLVRLDVIPSPSQIYVLPVQNRISTYSGIWCVSRTLWGIPLSDIRMKTPPHTKLPIPTILCYNHGMKRLLPVLIGFVTGDQPCKMAISVAVE